MNVDHILSTLNEHDVAFLLIGGVNFLLRHKPVLTYDVDVWVDDRPENLDKCEAALAALDAEWGVDDDDWKPVAQHAPGWLQRQAVFCLISPQGSIDIFRSVAGLNDWSESCARAIRQHTGGGVTFRGLCDEDMLRSQYALAERDRKLDRIATLEAAIRNGGS